MLAGCVWCLNEGGGVDARCAELKGATITAAGALKAMVRMLLRRGASVNLQDSNGGTALMRAVFNGQIATVQELHDAKGDATQQINEGG